MSGFGDLLRRQREARFVGRSREIASFRAWLEDPDATRPITSITGPGGIGKSWLVASLTACAEELGWRVVAIDGHHVAHDRVGLAQALVQHPDLDDAIAGSNEDAPTLLVIDTFEALEPMAGLLQEALTQVESRTRALFSGRNALSGSWRTWDSLIRTHQLGGLSVDEQLEYFDRRGILGREERLRLMARSGGHPLTLSLACDLVAELGTSDVVQLPEWGRAVAGVVMELRASSDEDLTAVLEAAAILGAFSSESLEAVCPTISGSEAMTRLVHLSMVRAAGNQFELHDEVRRAVVEDLRLHRPERLESLRARALRYLQDSDVHDGVQGDVEGIYMVGRSLFEPSIYWVRSDEHDLLQMEEATPAIVDELLAIQRPFHPLITPPPDERNPSLLPRLIEHSDASVRVLLDSSGEVLGYGFWLTLSQRTEDLFPPDGVVRAATTAALRYLGADALPSEASSLYYLSTIASKSLDPNVLSSLVVDMMPIFARGGAYLALSADRIYVDSLRATGFEPIGFSWSLEPEPGEQLEAYVLDLSRSGVSEWLSSLVEGRSMRRLPLGGDLASVVGAIVDGWEDDGALSRSPVAAVIEQRDVLDDEERADAVRRLLRRSLLTERPWPTVERRIGDALARAGITELPRGPSEPDAERRAGTSPGRRLSDILTPTSPADTRPTGNAPEAPPADGGRSDRSEVSIRLMGDFAVTRAGRTLDVGSGIVARVLKVVATKGTRTTDELLEDLWPEGDPEAGATRLRTTIYRLRQLAGADIVERRGREIRLGDRVATDVSRFVALAEVALAPAPGGGIVDIASVEDAIRAYGGELLPADRYEDWAAPLRERLVRIFLSLLDLAADVAEAGGDQRKAIGYLERAIETDRFDEQRYVRAAALLLRLGWPSRARAMCRRAAAAAASLDVAPCREIQELEAELLRNGSG